MSLRKLISTKAYTAPQAVTSNVAVQLPYTEQQIMVSNFGTAPVFVTTGGASVQAGVNNVPIGPGAQMTLDCDKTDTYAVAYAIAGGTISVYFTPSQGM